NLEVAWVTDPDPAVAARWGEFGECEFSTSYEEMCARTRPDFVFALGRHDAMASEAAFLIDQRIPFLLEKPGAVRGREIAPLAARASARWRYAIQRARARPVPDRDGYERSGGHR